MVISTYSSMATCVVMLNTNKPQYTGRNELAEVHMISYFKSKKA